MEGTLHYRVTQIERDAENLMSRVGKLEVAKAEDRRDLASMQRSVDANTTTLKWVLTAVSGTGLTVLGAVLTYAVNGG